MTDDEAKAALLKAARMAGVADVLRLRAEEARNLADSLDRQVAQIMREYPEHSQ